MHAGTLIGRAEHSVLLGSVRTELSSTGEYCAKNTDMSSNNQIIVCYKHFSPLAEN